MSELQQYYGRMMDTMNRADIHVHTNRSDGQVTPEEAVELAINEGLHTIAITDHDTVQPSYEAREYAERVHPGEITVLPSAEITSSDGHILALGITSDIKPRMTIEETLHAI